VQQVGDDRLHAGGGRQLFHDGQRAIERQAGLEQRGQHLREGHQVALANAAAAARERQ
jgi:hypothetical protein